MDTPDIKQIEQQIVDEFLLYDDWMDRYNYLIELGKDLPLIDSKYKTEENLIHGCQSRVWLRAELINGCVTFTADSDAVITRGIISLLIRVLNNRTPKEIIEAPLAFLETIGLKDHLSPTRSNGLTAMVKQMKMYAQAFELLSHQS